MWRYIVMSIVLFIVWGMRIVSSHALVTDNHYRERDKLTLDGLGDKLLSEENGVKVYSCFAILIAFLECFFSGICLGKWTAFMGWNTFPLIVFPMVYAMLYCSYQKNKFGDKESEAMKKRLIRVYYVGNDIAWEVYGKSQLTKDYKEYAWNSMNEEKSHVLCSDDIVPEWMDNHVLLVSDWCFLILTIVEFTIMFMNIE